MLANNLKQVGRSDQFSRNTYDITINNGTKYDITIDMIIHASNK